MSLTLLIVIIVLALIFDYINGFHDAANSIATVVSTKVLTPFQAVLWAAFFNFLAYWIFHLNVADTVAKTVNTLQINLVVILAGVIAAIFWNLLTWWFGIPSSSSHTLIGGFAGAAIAHAGFSVVNMQVIAKVASFLVLAPIMGMIMAYMITVLIMYIFRRASPRRADTWFKRLQLVSSAAFSLGHGGNDAQKVMGIISVALIAGGHITSMKEMPNWVPLSCYAAIAIGTMSGGWKIVKTMGSKITKVTPFEGVAAETAGAVTLFFTESLKFPWTLQGEQIKGIPVSTTHTITGSIIGVGVTKRISAVKWGVTGKLLIAWVITIPISAAMGALIYYICTWCGL